MVVKKLLLVFFSLLLTQQIFAQTGKISGFVTDSEGEPLPGVTVVIQGTTKGNASELDGYYQILNVQPGSYTLRASYVGFSTVIISNVEVNIDLTTEIDFVMEEETIEGEEIVVIAEQPVVKRDVSSSQANISREDIDALPVASVASVIGLQAGVEGLSIRGSGADEVAFNLNGFTLRSGRDNSAFTGVSVTSIQSVQVQTGGFNAEYGNLRSGLINVTSKEGNAERYTLDGLIRITPPQEKNVGQRINDPNSFWIRPYLDDAVAWTGTGNGAWDEYTQQSYPEFDGWNTISQRLLGDGDPSNDLTPEAAQQAFLWQHRKNFVISDPDYEIDLTLGGPVPYLSEKLGDLRFSTSFRETQNMYIVPLSRDRYKQTTFQTKLTSNIRPGMKLSVDGLYSRETGTGASTSGNPGFFVSPSGVAGSMDRVSFINTRIFSNYYWAPSERVSANIGAEFTHSINDKTFYEIRVNNYFSSNSTNPGAFRDTTAQVFFGGVGFDEAPFGFFDEARDAVGTDLRLAGGISNSRDSSEVSDFNLKASITSQINRFHLVKAGFEFVRTNSRVNYGRFDPLFQDSNTRSVWDTTPIRMAAFVQDKIEFRGMIANLGLRLTYNNPNIDWYVYDEHSIVFEPGRASLLDTVRTERVKPQLVLQPRLGVSFPITESSKLFFNYGHSVQLPDPENLYLVRIEPATNNISRIASPGNKLPRDVQYELGYEQSLFDNYLIRISGYYKDTSNDPVLQTFISRDGGSYSVSRPFRYRDTRGLELTLRKQRGKFFWGEVNYTYDVRSNGFFGLLRQNENFLDQQEFEKRTSLNDINRRTPLPFARFQLYFQTPYDIGPEFLGGHPLGGWQFVPLVSWRAGSPVTWAGGGSIPGIQDNLTYKDFWGTSLRITRNFDLGNGSRVSFFADITNVINRRYFDITNSGLEDTEDYNAYFQSLHLPRKVLEDIGQINNAVPGNDQPGDYRPADVAFVPIEATASFASIANPNTRALYYDTQVGEYFQYVNGSFIPADEGLVKQVLDDKAYINMPNQQFFNFLDPRTFRFGIRFSF